MFIIPFGGTVTDWHLLALKPSIEFMPPREPWQQVSGYAGGLVAGTFMLALIPVALWLSRHWSRRFWYLGGALAFMGFAELIAGFIEGSSVRLYNSAWFWPILFAGALVALVIYAKMWRKRFAESFPVPQSET